MIEIYSNILVSIMDFFVFVIFNNLNIVMKVFVFVIIFMVIFIIMGGIYGMNIDYLFFV